MNLLQTARELEGHSLRAVDGEIGDLEGFYFDDSTWAIRYLVATAGGRLTGRHVLINPGWIGEISWKDHAISVDLTREAIKLAPDFDPSKAISQDYERRLFRHYGRPVYWRRG